LTIVGEVWQGVESLSCDIRSTFKAV